jgi:predicted CXXCH cytochrome family protein
MARKKRRRGGVVRRSARAAGLPNPLAAPQWHRGRNPLVIAAAVLFVGLGALGYAFFAKQSLKLPAGSTAPAAIYVGSQACAGCHKEAYEAWKGSDHALAMQHVSATSVLGNFADAKFGNAGITSTFFRRDGKFFVNTDGPDGKLRDYEIKYVFGIRPLQQYLVELVGGRLQALSIAWDSRPKDQGGQRWFHLYPNDRITHEDELHWTRPAHNWNFMCADCHSTDLRKNYDAATDSFKTRWAEISVGCEACHGPGSDHVAWAQSHSPPLKKGGEGGFDVNSKIPLNPPFSKGENLGFIVRFDERRGVTWNPNEATGKTARSQPRKTEREIDVCAPCHARRAQIGEGYAPGKPFLDHYRPALLTPPLYHSDGQQRDEVYTWGSFLQSKMHASGVTCSDCHEPHSGRLRAEGNTLCASCHASSKYDAPAHHHHKSGSPGAVCVSCHMPATTYMVVDPRRDHSLRVPRPDQSVQLGTPNACNGCHRERDARWAAAQVQKWHGRAPQGFQRFAEPFAAGAIGAPDTQAQLRAITADASHPAIARASALSRLGASSARALDTVAAVAREGNPLLRLAALQSLANAPSDVRFRVAAPLLSDPLRVIRIEAASVLAPVPAAQLNAEQRAAFDRAATEYIASQKYNADRAEARVNLGTFYANRADSVQAEGEMRAAIRLDPLFVPAYVNLADLYRALGRDPDGERILRDGLKATPKNAMLHHALGLALVRLKRPDEALAELETGTMLDPTNVRFSYVYAVALHSTGKVEEAVRRLEKTLATQPNSREVLEALVSFHSARGDRTAAKKYQDRLDKLGGG